MRDARVACCCYGQLLCGPLLLAVAVALTMPHSAHASIGEPPSDVRAAGLVFEDAQASRQDAAVAIALQNDAEEEIRFQERLRRAKAELEARNTSRREAGWTPKSWEEQQVTRLSRLRDMRIRKQELALTRAEFEKARGEVYMQIARDFVRYGFRRHYAYRYRYAPDLYTGYVYRYYRPYEHWANDRLALQLASHFANRAARSKGIAAAQQFHANTYYERLIRNSESRISSLQKQIGFAKLAGNVP